MCQEAPSRRKRFGKLPVPAERAELYWGVYQPELSDLNDGLTTARLVETPEFKNVFGRKLRAIDNRNRTGYGNTMGRPAKWSALELELVLLYRRVAGLETVKETLIHLKADQDARERLGFTEAVPSAPTITRYIRQHFDEVERAELHLALDRQLREKVTQLPDFDQEARIIGMDGSQQGTRYTPPIPVGKERREREEIEGKEPKEIVNADIPAGQPGAITAPTAGYVGGHNPKSGQGWQMVAMWTEHGTPLAWDISPVNEAEQKAAARILTAYEQEIRPQRDPKIVSVCTADSGFKSNVLHERFQQLGVVPNIHKASHKVAFTQPDEETENASKLARKWRFFKHPSKPHYENWSANGHGDLRCRCGAGGIKRDFPISSKGVTPVTKGHCSNCGNVTITSGQWRRTRESMYWVRCYQGDTPDYVIGNSLTFNDELSKTYGEDRFGFGESIHATLNRRFGLLADKSWFRDITQVKTEFAITMSTISVLLLERHARANRPQPTPLPVPSAPVAQPFSLAA